MATRKKAETSEDKKTKGTGEAKTAEKKPRRARSTSARKTSARKPAQKKAAAAGPVPADQRTAKRFWLGVASYWYPAEGPDALRKACDRVEETMRKSKVFEDKDLKLTRDEILKSLT